jgi:hypothetical protein
MMLGSMVSVLQELIDMEINHNKNGTGLRTEQAEGTADTWRVGQGTPMKRWTIARG